MAQNSCLPGGERGTALAADRVNASSPPPIAAATTHKWWCKEACGAGVPGGAELGWGHEASWQQQGREALPFSHRVSGSPQFAKKFCVSSVFAVFRQF